MTPQEQEQADRQKRLLIDLANSYREMQLLYAWRDLDEFLNKLDKESNRDLDIMAVEHLSATVAAHGRGVRDAIKKIRAHIGFRTSEGPKQ